MNEKDVLIRLGMVGSGRIAGRTVAELALVEGIEPYAVYNPHAGSAERFAAAYDIPHAYEDWDAFLASVDAVYIAAPHAAHAEYVRRALLAGKHVLCEKPLCLRKDEAVALFSLAEKHHLALMEGIKTVWAPGYRRVLALLQAGTIGELRDVEACFTRLTPDGLRELMDPAGGSLTEFGSYTLLPILGMLGMKYRSIHFDAMLDADGLDVYTKVSFRYADAMALSKTGLKVKSDGQLLVSGTGGYIRVAPPWWKTERIELCFEDSAKNRVETVPFEGYGLRYEWRAFVQNVREAREGRAGVDPAMRELSIGMADVMEQFLAWRRAQRASSSIHA